MSVCNTCCNTRREKLPWRCSHKGTAHAALPRLRPLQAAACTDGFAFGPRAGQKEFIVQVARPRDTSFTQAQCADQQGFSLHAAGTAASASAGGWSSGAATSVPRPRLQLIRFYGVLAQHDFALGSEPKHSLHVGQHSVGGAGTRTISASTARRPCDRCACSLHVCVVLVLQAPIGLADGARVPGASFQRPTAC